MSTRDSARPLVSVVTRVASDLAYLVQTEFRMARAEMGETLSAASNAGAYLAIGGAIALCGLIALLFDVARWLAVAGMPYEWGLLLVAVVALAVGGVLAMVGVNRFQRSAFVPNRTLEQVREDYAVALGRSLSVLISSASVSSRSFAASSMPSSRAHVFNVP